METKRFHLADIKTDTKPGRFKARVSVFGNVDRGGDRVMKGAFERTLTERGLPPIYYSHDWDAGPIGATINASESKNGLDIEGDLYFEDDPFVKRIYRAMKDGVLREFSFAYDVLKSATVEEDGDEVRELHELDLFEVGPTLVGMNPATELLATPKSLLTVPNVTASFAGTSANEFLTFKQFTSTTSAPVGSTVVYIPVYLPADEPKADPASADVSDVQASEPTPEAAPAAEDAQETKTHGFFALPPRHRPEGENTR